MGALRKSLPILAAIAMLAPASGLQAETRLSGVAGRVVGESSPLAAAHIYAYQLADLSLHKVLTDVQGNFLFQDLPAGLYKIIAHKMGFMPAVIMLTRTTAQAYQFVEVQLAQRQAGDGPQSDDYWSIRARVPADVLRDIETDEAQMQLASLSPPPGGSTLSGGNFQTTMKAQTGVDQNAADGGQVSTAGLGIEGQVGKMQVGLHGTFTQLNSSDVFQSGGGALGTGKTSSLSIDLAPGPGSRVNIMSLNNRMIARGESGESPVDFEQYQVSWSQQVGTNGRSDISAHYTSENNFHRHATIDPLDIPDSSRSWRFEGSYTLEPSDRNTLQAGLRFREREFGYTALDRPGKAYEQQALSSVDLFGRGGLRIEPAVLMEYGLYSTLSDGSLALTPQGGVVLQLGSNWQLETTAAHRVYADTPANPDFLPTLFEQRDLCEQGSESCYQVNLSRKDGDDNKLTFGAVQRTVGDTMRVYFSDDFFDRLESLYLVRGDQLPELRLGFRHRISPRIVTTLDSSFASGGGGEFFAANGQPYRNQVHYLVTSLDTQIQPSSTGIFIAFHHLEQQLDPAPDLLKRRSPVAQMEFERLQLMVNQNLNFLLDLASDWAVQLNMELSRGGDVTSNGGIADDKIRRRILGGIAVKF